MEKNKTSIVPNHPFQQKNQNHKQFIQLELISPQNKNHFTNTIIMRKPFFPLLMHRREKWYKMQQTYDMITVGRSLNKSIEIGEKSK